MRSFAHLRSHASTIRELSRFLRLPLTGDDCHAIVRQRLIARERRFLQVVRSIYRVPSSPYLRLLKMAGCELGDLEALVTERGVEGALDALYRAGVYCSFEEFRGRKAVVRGSQRFTFTFGDFDNPRARKTFETHTGGSRGAGLPVAFSIGNIAARIPARHLCLEGVDAVGKVPIIWHNGLRLAWWLSYARLRTPPRRWFVVRGPHGNAPGERRSRQLATIARLLAVRQRLRLPLPEVAPLDATETVLEAVVDASRIGRGCVVNTTPSLAVRIAASARRRGVSLDRVSFLTGGEPLTEGKAAEIQSSAARVGSAYAFSEGGTAGIPCARPREPDDMHLAADCFAVILGDRQHHGTALRPYMFTSLLNTAPKILLNVEIDDFGILERRRCDCPLENLGYDLHLANVRSFTKLTGEGVTVLGTSCVQAIEQALPATFGGQSVDYQLLEAEDVQHLTRLFLLVHPRLGDLDEDAIRRRFMSELERTDWRGGVPDVWKKAATIQVIRKEPVVTRSGKLFAFHTIASPHLDREVQILEPPRLTVS